jgi:4-hydroxythreonine-4-phosphate dehydrogenase
MSVPRPILALTQGDPAGIGPEILLKLLQDSSIDRPWTPLLIAERVALEALKPRMGTFPWERLVYFSSPPQRDRLESLDGDIAVLDPVAESRTLTPGQSGPADAAGALEALDTAVAATRSGLADAVVTAPVSKSSIATHHRPDFTGHTEYLAAGAGLDVYGRDYLMAFLSPDLQVALLSTHLPLRAAIDQVRSKTILEALQCLGRHAPGRIAVAGLNPHAGEGGLLGSEDDEEIAPAVQAAQEQGLMVEGPLSADSLFARARRGAFAWVLALYHDQGLIAVKTAGFGRATNWTLGLPYLRTSVDHGTAFDLAGQGLAEHRPLEAVIQTTLKLLSGELPRS